MATTFQVAKNRAKSKLAADITDSDLSLTVTAGEGTKFPSTYPFPITIENEILKCTNRSTDTLTVVRAQEGTTAAAHASGRFVHLKITAKFISDLNAVVNAVENKAAFGRLGGWTADKFLRGTGVNTNATEGSFKDFFFEYFNPYYYKNWADFAGFTEVLAGTGSTTAGFNYAIFNTGATSASKARRYSANAVWLDKDSFSFRWRFGITVNPRSAQTNQDVWIGLASDPTALTNTQNHIAFKIVNNIIYASCGNGTNGTQVDTGKTTSQYATLKFYFKYMADNIKFYINDELVATITTNRPDDCGVQATISVVNSAAEAKEWWVYPLMMLGGKE